MKAIAAVTRNWGIGKDNQLLISIPEDMKFFRTKTKNAIVIMGRKTLESFPGGRPLKNRINIVITRDETYAPEGAAAVQDMFCGAQGLTIVNDVKSAAQAAAEIREKNLTEDGQKREIFVIGGASIYNQMAGMCDTIYITKVDAEYEADAYFPDLDALPDWYISEESEEFTYEDLTYKFVTYSHQ